MMFSVFSELNLKTINSNSTETQIKKWKKSAELKKCHNKLFKKISSSEPETYMSRIIGKLWKEKKNAPKIQIAFAISICETILNPNNLVIQVNEDKIKDLCMRNYVSFQNLKFVIV
jgi:hypothetical protein